MSISLDWAQLDAKLCSRALESINNLLSTSPRPAFLGAIVASSFSFGQVSPDLELIEVRDVYEEFLHVEDEDEEQDGQQEEDEQEDGGAGKNGGLLSPLASGLATPSLGAGWSSFARPLATPQLGGLGIRAHRPESVGSSQQLTSSFPFPRIGAGTDAFQNGGRRPSSSSSMYAAHNHPGRGREASPASGVGTPQPSLSGSDLSLQVHLRVKYSGNLSISLSTSIKVNYPSPAFMTLPLSLRVSGLAFQGTLVVAYEGDKKRLHLSILDTDRTETAQGSRLLRDLTVSSEVGQADKLVLKDVGKVEKFVLEVARKALEDEIAWPNFQSFAWT